MKNLLYRTYSTKHFDFIVTYKDLTENQKKSDKIEVNTILKDIEELVKTCPLYMLNVFKEEQGTTNNEYIYLIITKNLKKKNISQILSEISDLKALSLIIQ